MLEIDAKRFLAAITALREKIAALTALTAHLDEMLTLDTKKHFSKTTLAIMEAVALIGSRSAWKEAQRLHNALIDDAHMVNGHVMLKSLDSIESRFVDDLDDIRLFVIHGDQVGLMNDDPTDLLGAEASRHYSEVLFDCREARKCIALNRPTASVFHCMRMLEVSIGAIHRKLKLTDPEFASDRNWGSMLGRVKVKMEIDFPVKKRLKGTEGAFMSEVFTSLDCIRSAWRNPVMHVAGLYSDEEARHILLNCSMLLKKMATGFDQDGSNISSDPSLDLYAEAAQ